MKTVCYTILSFLQLSSLCKGNMSCLCVGIHLVVVLGAKLVHILFDQFVVRRVVRLVLPVQRDIASNH